MKTQSVLAIFCLLCVVGIVNSQQSLQQNSDEAVVPPTLVQIDQTTSEIIIDDPFAKRNSQTHQKRRHQGNDNGQIPQNAEQDWQIYKPFVYDEDEQNQETTKPKVNTQQFNEILKWGLLVGTGFLAYVLVKTCTRKRGRREMRRAIQEAQIRRQTISQPAPNVYFYHPYPQPVIQKQSQENLDNKILQAEIQLTRLKELKQQSLRQEFDRKKMEEEQRRRMEMVNVERNQQLQRRQNNFNVGYGPVFHVQQTFPQQPFQVQGIQPIRKRSNSFKTEISQQPILNNKVNYRNGIPIGKPIRQNDNDSSFASEYPQV